MKTKAIYEAVQNMVGVHGDGINQGAKSFKVKGGIAYFKTNKGHIFAVAIDTMHEAYFK